MARAGMSDLIAELRGMTDAGTADYTVGTVSYWSDDHLQTELDYHRNEFKHILIESNPTVIAANALEYKEFILSYQNIESGTVFYIQDADGGTLGTALYALDAQRGVVTFAADTAGSILYATGRAYNMNGAAADVWRKKAANASRMYDFSTDNHSMKRSQYMQHCRQMAEIYDMQLGVQTADLIRSDLNA